MARSLIREGQIRDEDNLSEAEHDAWIHVNLVTSGTLDYQDGTISGTGDVYAGSYYGDGSNLTGISAGLANIVEDDTPQLGADLDVQTYDITSGTSKLHLDSTTSVTILQAASAFQGSSLNLNAGDGSIIGGGVALQGGDASGGNGGDITLIAGDGTVAGGDINIKPGTGSSPGAVVIDATTAPSVTTNKLYNVAGDLTWNGIDLTASGSGLAEISEDTSPQLGGALDVNDFEITNGTAILHLGDSSSHTWLNAYGTYGSGQGHDLFLRAAAGGTSGGDAFLIGGDASAGVGGQVKIEGGSSTTAGGHIYLEPGLGSNSLTPGQILILAASTTR